MRYFTIFMIFVHTKITVAKSTPNNRLYLFGLKLVNSSLLYTSFIFSKNSLFLISKHIHSNRFLISEQLYYSFIWNIMGLESLKWDIKVLIIFCHYSYLILSSINWISSFLQSFSYKVFNSSLDSSTKYLSNSGMILIESRGYPGFLFLLGLSIK